MKTTAKILYMSLTQTQELTSITMLSWRDTLRTLSATNSRVPIDTTTNCASGSRDASERKTTPPLTSSESKPSLWKNAGSSTTSIPPRTHQSLSSPPSSLPSPCQPQLHLGSLHSTFQKPVLVPLLSHSMSNDAPNCTYVYRPLQHLFRPYPKPTPHPHPYPCLCLRNPYYMIKSMFDTSTNPMLRRLYKPTFRHYHNKLCCRTISINIPRWTSHKLCKLWPPLPRISPPSPTRVNWFIQNPPLVNIPTPVLRSKLYIQYPTTYNGKTPTDARRFLAAYKAWASDQGTGMQVNQETAAVPA